MGTCQLMLGGNHGCDGLVSHPGKSRNTPCCLMLQHGPLGSMQTLPLPYFISLLMQPHLVVVPKVGDLLALMAVAKQWTTLLVNSLHVECMPLSNITCICVVLTKHVNIIS